MREGDRVLDVGCGFGDNAIQLARVVRPEGERSWASTAAPPPHRRRGRPREGGRGEPGLERVDAPVLIGHDVRDAIEFELAIGPAGEVFREAGDEAVNKRPEIEEALAEAIRQQTTAEDGTIMSSSSWVISAKNTGGSAG